MTRCHFYDSLVRSLPQKLWPNPLEAVDQSICWFYYFFWIIESVTSLTLIPPASLFYFEVTLNLFPWFTFARYICLRKQNEAVWQKWENLLNLSEDTIIEKQSV